MKIEIAVVFLAYSAESFPITLRSTFSDASSLNARVAVRFKTASLKSDIVRFSGAKVFCCATEQPNDLQMGDSILKIMCTKGINCKCAENNSTFDVSLNIIGASDGLGGRTLLEASRSLELRDFKNLVWADRNPAGIARRNLIQISQCPGIGKTTLLALMARCYPQLLAEASGPDVLVEASGPEVNVMGMEMIGSLVTYNGYSMSGSIVDVPMEAAICTRVLYAALVCHSAYPGRRCPNLRPFDYVAQSIAMVDKSCRIRVPNTLQLLWGWFGRKPIFIGIDEALKCSDGTEESDKTLQVLMTASGKFLDIAPNDPPVFVVFSSLSPEKLLPATLASNRFIRNILVYPVDRKIGIQLLNSTIKDGLMVDKEVLAQVEAVTVGHPRAIQCAAEFLSRQVGDPAQLLSWGASRPIYLPLLDYLSDGTAPGLASCPEPEVFDYFLSAPPLRWKRGVGVIMGTRLVLIDDLVFTGKAIVTSTGKMTLAGWWLLAELNSEWQTPLDISSLYPSASLLREAYKAGTKLRQDDAGSLFEAFCVYFIAEAMLRGGETLRAVLPQLYQEDPGFRLPREDIYIETMNLPASGLTEMAQAQLVMNRVQILKRSFPSTGSKGVILMMPPSFPAVDAIVVARDKVIGVQIKTAIEQAQLEKKITKLRTRLEDWKANGCDILGPDGLLLYVIGVLGTFRALQLEGNEALVTAQQLRAHFVDAFFRCGLTVGE